MDFTLPILAPSILASDYTRLGEEIDKCNQADIQWLHCDIMDGHFVPNISYGPKLVKAAGSCTDAFLDVHLMIENPDQYIERFADAGADQITVHQEACPHLHRTIQNIHNQGITAGVAINPGTSLQTIEPVINNVDLVLLMSVNPGFGGQSFIENTYQRLQKMSAMRDENGAGFLIEVDGGINLDNIRKVTQYGADVLVAGSAVFKAKNIPKRIENLTQKAKLGKGTIA
ncbi:ribulose-phosphate 3-epimerase [Aliifodinibius salipaludis]|uniref:Ribulose-phosphate 3-epimerase n=1 Tax=Fodinibius salipaludis TaxID=2032627 RepID=A0A2A2GG40_9BACT|nr:ribulose-phosphate 3-epimerase [Aliifodinibius salipaludis]PAU95859.1 ribulose-phosphate 3-epimerase [Aliifodinibius salipaludis]